MASLSARDISERFQELASQEQSRIEDGVAIPADPVSRMSFSKSHLDRLYKGSSSLPSKRFLRIFLGITSRAAGIHPEHHRELCQRAEDLLMSEHRNRHNNRAKDPTSTSVPAEAVVATLQMQLELERAKRAEDRLRWALSDTQVLMGTLLQIINALRDIITDIDTQLVRGPNGPDVQEVAKRQRSQAQSYKVDAEVQFDRANQRRRLLETLWDQAHGNLQRLALHAEVTDIPSLPDGLALPSQLLGEDFQSRPALVDIGTALGKAQEHNDAEEQSTLDLQHTIMADTPLQPDDEVAILVAATRLTDDRTRGTALRTLLKNWPRHPETRDALVRLAHDEQSDIRLTTARSLAEGWAGEAVARDALVVLTRDSGASVRETAVLGLAEGWAGEVAARDALVVLTRDSGASVRETAVLGLAEGWAGDVVARDALVALAHDDDVYVRMTVAESLVNGWLNDAIARTALHTLNRDASLSVRWAAWQGIAKHEDFGGGRPQQTDQSSNLLLAVRVPRDHGAPESIPVIDRLRRGIDFDSGVTILWGSNGAGKTILLNALALLGPLRVISDSPLRAGPAVVSRQLAQNLEVVWNEDRTPEGIYHLTDFDFERQGRNHGASGLENWIERWFSLIEEKKGPNRLFLLDEPAAYLDREARKIMFEQLNQLVNQGCQVIIASVLNDWLEMPTARVVRIDRRALRKFRH
ncbi:HEAT repeat domain-containing protein [Streptomyces torulosus]|uniref:HEAT repeat domain-containing protein n=1 Tax=Streptomyces torulosus TaxID=68276 RepID=UPI000D150528|nr:HEAT repeat domain-containing protein [Streptomyces torulosus]